MHYSKQLLDDLNLRIMDMLGRDSSTPFVELAKQIGISCNSTYQTLKIILLGYDHLAFIGINVQPSFADESVDGLLNLEEIHEIHGTFDLFLKIRAKDLEQMRDVVENKIGKLARI
jgi:Lrp/AsnC family transcriptional regulator, regulator for asnA, asnC and gidA